MHSLKLYLNAASTTIMVSIIVKRKFYDKCKIIFILLLISLLEYYIILIYKCVYYKNGHCLILNKIELTSLSISYCSLDSCVNIGRDL